MKLYKYRSIDFNLFENNLESLESGYLWFVDVLTLNDPSDSTIYHDRRTEEERLVHYFENNKATVFRKLLSTILRNQPIIVQVLETQITDKLLLEMAEQKFKGNYKSYLTSFGATALDLERYDLATDKLKKDFDSMKDELNILINQF